MVDFLNRLNEIHSAIKNGSRERLDIEIISKEFLLENKIIKISNNQIIGLNTELIAENYLMLWNNDLIHLLPNLEEITLANIELRELELSSLKKLRVVNLISFTRGTLLYIAENQNLEKIDYSGLKLNGENVCPIELYAHPNQVKRVFPNTIEKDCKDKEGYLVVNLHLAPPKSKTVDSTDFNLKYLSRFKEAELGTILKKYWEQQPEYYSKYLTLEDAESHEQEAFSVLLEIEKRVCEDFYINKNISFNPHKDVQYPSFEERKFDDKRRILNTMSQIVG